MTWDATGRRYLMCRPTYFAVDYAINPWMDPSAPVDRDRAVAQWETLRRVYLDLGHTVELIDPVPGLPDMVFAANGATVVDGRAMVLGMSLDAVIYERFGSISQFVFGLPVIRILPRKSAWIRRFFDLER